MTDRTPEQERAAVVAKGLSARQIALVTGDYDPEFASMQEASELIRLGLWHYDPRKQRNEDEYYDLDLTPFGLAVREHLRDGGE